MLRLYHHHHAGNEGNEDAEKEPPLYIRLGGVRFILIILGSTRQSGAKRVLTRDALARRDRAPGRAFDTRKLPYVSEGRVEGSAIVARGCVSIRRLPRLGRVRGDKGINGKTRYYSRACKRN